MRLDVRSVLSFRFPTFSMIARVRLDQFAGPTIKEITTTMLASHKDQKIYQLLTELSTPLRI